MSFARKFQITHGSTRWVFLFPSFVVKAPRFPWVWCLRKLFHTLRFGKQLEMYDFQSKVSVVGWQAWKIWILWFAGWFAFSGSFREVYRFLWVPHPDRCPVWFFLPGLLVVMPRCDPDPDDHRPNSRWYDSNAMRYDAKEITFDDRPANWGLYKGKRVSFDYGGIEDPVK